MLSPVPVENVVVVHYKMTAGSLLFLVILRPRNRPIKRKGYDRTSRNDYLAGAVVAGYGMTAGIGDYLTS